jgi:hypothetical protein
LVFIIANIYLFGTSLKEYTPKLSAVDMKSAKSLLGTGSVFFFIQIGAMILFQTDNIIITNTLGPQEVTTFNLAYKYFYDNDHAVCNYADAVLERIHRRLGQEGYCMDKTFHQ